MPKLSIEQVDTSHSRPNTRPLSSAAYAPLNEDPELTKSLATGFGNTTSTSDDPEIGLKKPKNYTRIILLCSLLIFAVAIILTLILEPRSRYGISFGFSKMFGVHVSPRLSFLISAHFSFQIKQFT
jgi:hypothetical protein